MRKKVRGQPGFTLIEVLVVVAIIVILLAIAIPAVMGALDNARHNADAKYERAAAALATARWTSGAANSDAASGEYVVYAYDSENGKLFVPTGTSPKKGTACGECRKDGHAGLGIYVRLNLETGKVDVCWAATGLSGTDPNNTAFHWDAKDELCGG